jgi:hypothetical protein
MVSPSSIQQVFAMGIFDAWLERSKQHSISTPLSIRLYSCRYYSSTIGYASVLLLFKTNNAKRAWSLRAKFSTQLYISHASPWHSKMHAPGVGVRATRPVSAVSDRVYTQQQPIVRRRILSETFKVLKSSYGRIHGILPWSMRGRPRNDHLWKPVIKTLQRFHSIDKSLRNAISAESNNRYTFPSCTLPIFKPP